MEFRVIGIWTFLLRLVLSVAAAAVIAIGAPASASAANPILGKVQGSSGTEQPGNDPSDKVVFIIDDDVCTRCALCVDRCPTGVIILGKVTNDWSEGDPNVRTNRHGYAYGVRF